MNETTTTESPNKTSGTPDTLEVVREYGPFEGAPAAHGVTFDGANVWVAGGERLRAFDPTTGEVVHTVDTACDAGTAFDGTHLYQLAGDRILKIVAASGKVVGSLPAPGSGSDSGLTWAEGTLYVGQYRTRKIHQIDATTGAVLRTIASDRFVTGVSWTDGELWHGTWEGDESELRRVDPKSGDVLARARFPEGMGVSGLEAGKDGVFYCGGGQTGKVRAVRRPGR